MAALIVVWGSAYILLKVAVHDIDPAWMTAGRLWVGAATLGALALATGMKLPPLTPRPDPLWGWYAFNGIVGTALPFFLYASAARGIPSAVNAICNGATPIFTLLLAWFAQADAPPTRLRVTGVLLGFAGLLVLVAPRLTGAGVAVEGLALAAALSGAAFYAMANVAIRRAPPAAPVIGSLILCITGALAASLMAAWSGPPAHMPGWPALAAMIFLGVVNTGIATVGYVRIIQRRGPVFMSMAIYIAPLWATALGLMAGEALQWTVFAALVLILGGVVLASRPAKAAV